MNRYQIANKVSCIGILGNLFLLAVKGLIGFITHSQAMIADAFNSAGDIFSSIMTLIGNKIASRPKDKDHNFGYGKAEYIYSIFIAISMVYVSLKLFGNAIESLFTPSSYHFSIHLILGCILTIGIKFCLYIYTHKKGKMYQNLLIEANAIDHRNDCFLTIGTLIASICGAYQIFWVDALIGIIISTWIFIGGIKIYQEAYYVLMDRAIDSESLEKVYEIIGKYPEVQKVTHFNSTPVGYQYQVNFTIFVDGNLSTYQSHEIANLIEKDLMQLESIYLAVIHVNPI